MFWRIILFWILGYAVLLSQSPLEGESWFYQLLTRLKSKDPQIVRSAQEALIACGSSFQEKLLSFKQDPRLAPSIQHIFDRLKSPESYHLEQAILLSEDPQKALLQTLTSPLTIQFTYDATYFSQKTVEVYAIQGDIPRLSKLVQQIWIHQLDQSGYFQVIEGRFSKDVPPAAIQIGGEVNWLFLQGNARLQLDLWMKQDNRTLRWKTLLTGSGDEEWNTALKLIEPQVQLWLQESLPQKKEISHLFSPPESKLEWIGLFLAQEGRFTEALSLLSSPQTDAQRFNLAIILEAAGQLTQAIEQIQAIPTLSAEQKNALHRLKVRTYSD